MPRASCGGPKIVVPVGFVMLALQGVSESSSASQIIMVVLVIAFPRTVTTLLDKPLSAENISKFRMEIPPMEEVLPVDFSRPGRPR